MCAQYGTHKNGLGTYLAEGMGPISDLRSGTHTQLGFLDLLMRIKHVHLRAGAL